MKTIKLLAVLAAASCAGDPAVDDVDQASDTVNLCPSHALPPGTPFAVPADDAPRQARDPANDLDEWFWTTKLVGLRTGKIYSAETFIFRFRAFGQDVRWGQVSVTDPQTGAYHQGQVLVPGLFAETTDGFDLDLGVAGAPRASGGGGVLDHVSATTFDGTAFDLRFANLSNVMVQLGGGHAQLTDPLDGVTVGENYYYSRPTMAAAGTITVAGVTEPVIGEGWFDREWRACCFGGYFHQPDPIFTQWHWGGFHLSDGSAWSFYRIFVQGHEDDGLMSDTANFLDSPARGCRQGALTHGQFTLTHDGAWTSPHSGHTYPTRYHFVVASEGLDVWVTPRVVDQEATEVPLALGFQPWYEGWATVTGTHRGVPVSGDGYLELFGFPG